MSKPVTEIVSRDTLESTYVYGDFMAVVHELNGAAANGRAMVVFDERRRDGRMAHVGLERMNITKVRPVLESDEDAYTA